MKISGRVFAGDRPFGSVLLLLFKKSHGFWCASTSPNGRTGAYELHFNDEPGDYILFAISTQFRVCQREVVLQTRETEMTLDIQLDPFGPPHSITVGQPPESTSSRLVRCLTCGATAPLEWLKSRHQQEIYLPEWPHVNLLQGRKSTIGWMHAHRLPTSWHPTEIIPRPADLKKEAAEEMYEALERLTTELGTLSNHWAAELVRIGDAALRMARGESPDA